MDIALPVGFAIGLWWSSTMLLLYRAGLPARTHRATMHATSGVMLLGLAGIWLTRDAAGEAAVYAGFACALAVWAWHEVSYLFGFVSGPRPAACPAGVRGWQRFRLGVETCLYHELAIVATAALIAAMTAGASNRTALWTFLILWLMRWSAKLNIFLGVRNLHQEYWPQHLEYLKSFVRERPMNGLFPWSVGAALAGVVALAVVAAGADGAGRSAALMLATLLALALIEHGLLMLKVNDDALWLPALRRRASAENERLRQQV